METIKELRNDFTDVQNYTHIDAFFTEDDMEEGRTIAIIDLDTNKVFFIDNRLRGNSQVIEAIKEVVDNNHIIDDVTKSRELLRKKGYFSQNLWNDGDIIGRGEEKGYIITPQQAIEVMDLMGRRFNAELGINWDTIDSTIDEYFS